MSSSGREDVVAPILARWWQRQSTSYTITRLWVASDRGWCQLTCELSITRRSTYQPVLSARFYYRSGSTFRITQTPYVCTDVSPIWRAQVARSRSSSFAQSSIKPIASIQLIVYFTNNDSLVSPVRWSQNAELSCQVLWLCSRLHSGIPSASIQKMLMRTCYVIGRIDLYTSFKIE